MNARSLEVANEVFLLGIAGRVTGKEIVTTVIKPMTSNPEEDTAEGEALVTKRYPSVSEFKDADSYLNHLRSLLKKHAVNVEPLGFVCDETRALAFKADCDRALEAIKAHNSTAKFHKVTGVRAASPLPEVRIVRLHVAVNPELAADMFGHVTESLGVAIAAARAGDIKGLAYWQQRCKPLAGLVPGMVSQAVKDACDDSLRLLKELREAVNENGITPTVAGAMLDLSLLESAQILAAAPPAP